MLRDQGFSLAAQDLGFQPIVQVKPEVLFGMRRHSVGELIEPFLSLAEPAARFLGLPKAVIGQGQPEPVDDGAARFGISLETLLGEAGRDLKLSCPIREGALLGQRPELPCVGLKLFLNQADRQLLITCGVGGQSASSGYMVRPRASHFAARLDQVLAAVVIARAVAGQQ